MIFAALFGTGLGTIAGLSVSAGRTLAEKRWAVPSSPILAKHICQPPANLLSCIACSRCRPCVQLLPAACSAECKCEHAKSGCWPALIPARHNVAYWHHTLHNHTSIMPMRAHRAHPRLGLTFLVPCSSPRSTGSCSQRPLTRMMARWHLSQVCVCARVYVCVCVCVHARAHGVCTRDPLHSNDCTLLPRTWGCDQAKSEHRCLITLQVPGVFLGYTHHLARPTPQCATSLRLHCRHTRHS